MLLKRAAYAVALLLGAGFAACRAHEPQTFPGEADPDDAGGFVPAPEEAADLRAEAEECVAAAPATTTPAPRSDTAWARPPLRLLPSEVSVVAVGDSLTFGQASSYPGGDTSYPAVLGRLLGIPAVNRGVPGHRSKDLPDVDYLLLPEKQNRLVVMIGTNDIHNGVGATAAETYARLTSYVAARKASGWLVTVNTPPQWLAATPSSDPVAMEYEALIRNGFSHVADVAASPLIGRAAPAGPDRAYYGDELGHLNNAGYAALARIVKDSPAPKGEAPTITASMGVTRNKSLTAWFRDWVQVPGLTDEIERPAYWLNIAEGSAFSGNFEAFGRDRPSLVPSAVSGRPALRFNGPGTGFYVPRDRLTSHFIRTSSFVISVVMKVENITGSSSAPYDNDGVFSDAATRVGMSVKRPNTVTAFTYDGARWTHRDSALPLDTPVVVSMRLVNGKLGLRVNTTGEWSETPAGKIDTLSNALHIGTDSTTQKTFSGLIADIVVRRSYCEPTMAADDAYFRARYGVP